MSRGEHKQQSSKSFRKSLSRTNLLSRPAHFPPYSKSWCSEGPPKSSDDSPRTSNSTSKSPDILMSYQVKPRQRRPLSEPKPKEYQIRARPFTYLFTLLYTGANIGLGVPFLNFAALKEDKATELILSGSLLRNAAYGTLLGLVVAAYPLAERLISFCCYGKTYRAIASFNYGDCRLERKKQVFRLSASRFFPWYLHLFFASNAGAVIGTSVCAYFLPPIVGELAGTGLGAIVGFFLGILLLPGVIRSIFNITTKPPGLLAKLLLELLVFPRVIRSILNRTPKPPQAIKIRHWYQGSRHEVSVLVRVFTAGGSGYFAFLALRNPDNDPFFSRNQMLVTLLSSMLGLISPIGFSMLRGIKRCVCSGRQRRQASPKFQNRFSWYHPSPIDMPWYARLLFAVVIVATFLSSINNRNGWIQGVVAASLVAVVVALPLLVFLLKSLLDCCRLTTLSGQLDGELMLENINLSCDLPWYVRIAFGALSGKVLADVVNYSLFKLPPKSDGLLIVSIISFLAWVTPMLRSGIERTSALRYPKKDLALPWYIDFLAALLLGVLIGSTLSTLIPSLRGEVYPGYIGPPYLKVSNASLAAPSASVAGGISLFGSLFRFLCKKRRGAGSTFHHYEIDEQAAMYRKQRPHIRTLELVSSTNSSITINTNTTAVT